MSERTCFIYFSQKPLFFKKTFFCVKFPGLSQKIFPDTLDRVFVHIFTIFNFEATVGNYVIAVPPHIDFTRGELELT